MSYYNYYQKKEKKSEALEHFRKMDILMKDEIRQSVKETKIYGGNGLPVPDTEKKEIWLNSSQYYSGTVGYCLCLILAPTEENCCT